MTKFLVHLRRLTDGRVLLIGLPYGNAKVAGDIMGDMGDAGAIVDIDFDCIEVTDRTEACRGASFIDLIEGGLKP